MSTESVCPKCLNTLDITAISLHLESNHVGSNFAWACGQCMYSDADFDKTASHCLRMDHDVTAIRRERNREDLFLTALGEIQKGMRAERGLKAEPKAEPKPEPVAETSKDEAMEPKLEEPLTPPPVPKDATTPSPDFRPSVRDLNWTLDESILILEDPEDKDDSKDEPRAPDYAPTSPEPKKTTPTQHFFPATLAPQVSSWQGVQGWPTPQPKRAPSARPVMPSSARKVAASKTELPRNAKGAKGAAVRKKATHVDPSKTPFRPIVKRQATAKSVASLFKRKMKVGDDFEAPSAKKIVDSTCRTSEQEIESKFRIKLKSENHDETFLGKTSSDEDSSLDNLCELSLQTQAPGQKKLTPKRKLGKKSPPRKSPSPNNVSLKEECGACGFALTIRDHGTDKLRFQTIQTHVESQHITGVSFKCGKCDESASYRSMEAVRVHMNKLHLGYDKSQIRLLTKDVDSEVVDVVIRCFPVLEQSRDVFRRRYASFVPSALSDTLPEDPDIS